MAVALAAYDYDSGVLGETTCELHEEEPDNTEKQMLSLLNTYVVLIGRLFTTQWKALPNNFTALRKKSFYSKLYDVTHSLCTKNIPVNAYVQFCLETWPARNKNLPKQYINAHRQDANRFLGIECPSVSYLCRDKVLNQFVRQYEGIKLRGALFTPPDEAVKEIIEAGNFRLAFIREREGLSDAEIMSDIVFLGELPSTFLSYCPTFWEQDAQLAKSFGLSCKEYLFYRVQGFDC